MRVRSKATPGFQFTPEIFKLLGGEAPFQKCSRINSRRRVPLKINNVAFELGCARAEEMIEANFVEGRCRSVSGNVAADVVLFAIRSHDHGDSVPSDQALDPALELLIAGEGRLELMRNRVYVRRGGGERNIDADHFGMRLQPLQDVGRNVRAA